MVRELLDYDEHHTVVVVACHKVLIKCHYLSVKLVLRHQPALGDAGALPKQGLLVVGSPTGQQRRPHLGHHQQLAQLVRVAQPTGHFHLDKVAVALGALGGACAAVHARVVLQGACVRTPCVHTSKTHCGALQLCVFTATYGVGWLVPLRRSRRGRPVPRPLRGCVERRWAASRSCWSGHSGPDCEGSE